MFNNIEALELEDMYRYIDFLWDRYKIADANGDYDYAYELRVEIDKIIDKYNL